jgi:16S rRNA (uracil1498-N3)-methyltransferase
MYHNTVKIKARLFCPYISFDMETCFALEAKQAHYIRNVMRAKIGDYLGIFNGQQGEYAYQIIQLDKKHVIVKSYQKIKDPLIPDAISLVFSIIKKTPLEYLVQKSTELGIGKLQPVITDRTMFRDVNLDRLEIIAIEAAEQCGLTDIPKILPPQKLPDIMPQYQNIIFCDEKGGGVPIKQCHSIDKQAIDAILIGPEGGFTQSEADFLYQQSNAHAVSLGNRIMRAETAAIASLAIIQALR